MFTTQWFSVLFKSGLGTLLGKDSWWHVALQIMAGFPGHFVDGPMLIL